jgi:predicted GH43/DUF377 family glycosyl hydrolase
MQLQAGVVLVVVVAVFCASGCASAATYVVTANRVSQHPIISSQYPHQSVFTYNYNTAYLPLSTGYDGLLVRCQNQTASGVGPSKVAFTQSRGGGFQFSGILNSSVVFEPSEPWENYGTEDPRIAYRQKTGEYYLFYTAAYIDPKGKITARLALATSSTPTVKSSWKRYGALFPTVAWTKSGALLIRDGFPGPHYLIYGDSTLIPGIQIATSTNLLNYTTLPGIFIHTREDKFDSALVESGPPPMLLSDGNYLFIYNSARKYPQSKNGLQYNVGWAILDGKDPTHIIQRCEEPILSPTLPWEIGTKPYLGLTPYVVFVEGMRRHGNAPNSFVIYYGAADSVIGAAVVDVHIR